MQRIMIKIENIFCVYISVITETSNALSKCPSVTLFNNNIALIALTPVGQPSIR